MYDLANLKLIGLSEGADTGKADAEFRPNGVDACTLGLELGEDGFTLHLRKVVNRREGGATATDAHESVIAHDLLETLVQGVAHCLAAFIAVGLVPISAFDVFQTVRMFGQACLSQTGDSFRGRELGDFEGGDDVSELHEGHGDGIGLQGGRDDDFDFVGHGINAISLFYGLTVLCYGVT